MDKKQTNGDKKITLSILSNTPPCPGITFPKSLTLQVLLTNEKDKSPIIEIIGPKKPTKATK